MIKKINQVLVFLVLAAFELCGSGRTVPSEGPKKSLRRLATVLSTVLALALIFVTGCATVPLPPDTKVTPPAPHMPKGIAAFSGKWIGNWDGQVDHILIVEDVDAEEAAVIYAWGSGTFPWGKSPSGWTRVRGEFAGGELKLRVPHTGATVTYRMEADGSLAATQEGETVVGAAKIKFMSRARMVKVK